MSQQLAEILVRDKVVTAAQLADANAGVAAKDLPRHDPVKVLIDKKLIAESKLLYYLSQRFNLPSVNIAKFDIAPEIRGLMNTELVNKIRIVPIQANEQTVVVALADPTRLSQIEDLKFKFKKNVDPVLTTFSALDGVIQKFFGAASMLGSAMEKFSADATKSGATGEVSVMDGSQTVHEADSKAGDAPVISLVNGLFSECVRRMASDIHIEPYEKKFRCRMRIDGSLIEIAQIPVEMKRAVIARVKIMARMDIGESRIPQDGRIKMRVAGLEVDFRVNSMPTLFGEKIVLRMLNKGNLSLSLATLGFEPEQLERFKKGIYSPNGLVLVTGPTGSGKTTSLYSALAELNTITDNISTAEDPVEYNLEGINQVQVNKDVGLTFASVLRALLRQDPDSILVGEIRDYETAEVAIQAAMTGHLVLSTLHTNDAPGTIVRLTNMGVEPFLVVASVNTIVAQRLVRKVCGECKADRTIPAKQLIGLGFSEKELPNLKFVQGKGCGTCNNTGYKGRLAVYEVLDFSTSLKEMVLKGESIIELRKAARKEGMRSLRETALSRAAEGKTTIEEALSLTMEG